MVAINNVADGRGEVPAASAVRTTRFLSKFVPSAGWPGDALAEGSAASVVKEVDGRAPGQRAAGGQRRPRRRDEEARRSPPHGRGQQGVLALPLLSRRVVSAALQGYHRRPEAAGRPFDLE